MLFGEADFIAQIAEKQFEFCLIVIKVILIKRADEETRHFLDEKTTISRFHKACLRKYNIPIKTNKRFPMNIFIEGRSNL